MDGNPAGWYDDPDDAGQKRYWDGSAWTDDRAPAWNSIASDPSIPYDPLGTPDAPAGRPHRSRGSRTQWLVLAVVGVVAVVAVVAIVASTRDSGDPTTRCPRRYALQQALPATLEKVYAEQDLNVTVTGAACNDITVETGPYTTTCTVGFLGTNRTIVVTVVGVVEEDAVTIARSPSPTPTCSTRPSP